MSISRNHFGNIYIYKMDENLKGDLISKIKRSEEEIANLDIKRQNF